MSSQQCIIINKDHNTGKKNKKGLPTVTVTDADGNRYTTMEIGKQLWTVQNLRSLRFNDGTVIRKVTNPKEWEFCHTPALCFYKNSIDPVFISRFGALYNWWAVSTTEHGGIAPEGWRVPTDEDWSELQKFVRKKTGKTKGNDCSESPAKALCSTEGWNESDVPLSIGNDTDKNNSTGFSALPGGFRNYGGSFSFLGYNGYWWSSSEETVSNACMRFLRFSSAKINRCGFDRRNGLSVRLVKNS